MIEKVSAGERRRDGMPAQQAPEAMRVFAVGFGSRPAGVLELPLEGLQLGPV
jgi:hypothetical protein